jgi:hypothetical protein
MTEPKSERATPTQSNDQATIRWEDSGIKNSYANACNVSSTREEIVLNFGLNQAWERPQQEVQVQLTNRIILNPHTAKRVALLLGAVVQQYEKQFGALDIGAIQVQASPGSDMKPHVVK